MTDSLTLGPDRSRNVLQTRDGVVVAFGPDLTATARAAGNESRIEPGRINAHTHIYSGLAPLGMPPPAVPPENFLQILERIWWRLDRALDETSLATSAEYYVAHSLLAGTTTLIDHHESPEFIDGSLDVLGDVCQRQGMRAVLCFGATERNGGREEARKGLAECQRFILNNDRPLVRGVVGLHASFTVSDETLQEAGELCRELRTVLHVHLAEDAADIQHARELGYAGPLQRLLEHDALPAGSILAHGVHCSPEEVQLAAERGLWFVQNPRSNRGNRVGYAQNLGHSDRVAIGTDGYPSQLDDEAEALFEEAAAHGQAAEEVKPRLEASYRLVEELFGAPTRPLGPGALADATVADNAAARDVVVGGAYSVRAGKLVQADLEAIDARARQEAPRLWARMETL